MSIELLLVIFTITCWAAVSIAYWNAVAGWRARDRQRPRRPSFAELLMPLPQDQDPDWRRSFNHDNTNKKPTSDSPPLLSRRRPPDDQTRQAFTEGRTIRGNGNGGPTTPKPQFPPGRVLGPDGETIGYRPISPGRDTNPPPRKP